MENGNDTNVTISIEDITPDIAVEWLKRLAPGQRPPDERHINRIAADMSAGRYTCNGSPIRFDVNGHLIDGQHRLHAAVKAEYTLQTVVVVRGLPADAISTIDTGSKPRSASDVLKMQGVLDKVPAGMTAAVTLEHFDFELYPSKNATVALKVRLWQDLAGIHREQVRTLYQSLKSGRIQNVFLLAAGLRCAMNDEVAHVFLQEAFANTPGASPVAMVLHNTARDMLKKKEFSHFGPKSYQLSWCVFRTVQAFLKNENLQRLRPPGEWPREERAWNVFMVRELRSNLSVPKETIQ